MISTVTTTTVSILTNPSLFGPLGFIGALVLLAFLLNKQVFGVRKDTRFIRLQKALNIAIFPLLIGFLLIVLQKVISLFP